MGPRAALDGCGKSRPHRDSIPGPSSPWQVAMLCRCYIELTHQFLFTLEYYTTLRVAVRYPTIRRQKVHYPAHKSPSSYHVMWQFNPLRGVITGFSDLFHDRSFIPESATKMVRATHTAHPIIRRNLNIIRRRR